MNHLISLTFFSVMSLFNFVDDKIQFPGEIENWTSYATQVEQHERFSDDCDSIALTCVELLIRRGYPRDQLYLCTVITERGEHHLVGIADGSLLDMRMPVVWQWDEVFYEYQSCMKMSDIGTWRTVE